MGLKFDYKDGQTPLDEEEKESLKIKSITTQGELDEFEQLNIEKAVEWTIRANLKLEKILTEKFIKEMLSEDPAVQKRVAKKLKLSGISDANLFNLIENILLEQEPSYGNGVNYNSEHLSWMLRALAFSGQGRYMPTLETIARKTGDDKIKKHAKKSIQLLPKYNKWNKIISNEENWNPDTDINTNRLFNMTSSNNIELLRLASKKIHSQHLHDAILLDTLEERILERYKNDNNNRISEDSIAWMCRALAGSSDEKYKATILLVSTSAKNNYIRSKASEYLKYFN